MEGWFSHVSQKKSKAVEKPIFVLNQTTRYSELAQAMEWLVNYLEQNFKSNNNPSSKHRT